MSLRQSYGKPILRRRLEHKVSFSPFHSLSLSVLIWVCFDENVWMEESLSIFMRSQGLPLATKSVQQFLASHHHSVLRLMSQSRGGPQQPPEVAELWIYWFSMGFFKHGLYFLRILVGFRCLHFSSRVLICCMTWCVWQSYSVLYFDVYVHHILFSSWRLRSLVVFCLLSFVLYFLYYGSRISSCCTFFFLVSFSLFNLGWWVGRK